MYTVYLLLFCFKMRRADVDVMQKYEIQARLKRLHTGDMLSPGTDALSPSDSQSKASSEKLVKSKSSI